MAVFLGCISQFCFDSSNHCWYEAVLFLSCDIGARTTMYALHMKIFFLMWPISIVDHLPKG